MIAFHIKVYGRVQSVFFRKYTREKAEELKISGTVRNCSDGSVEIHAEGDKEWIDAFIAWCKVGPPKASVDKLDINATTVKNYSGFIVTH